jgi:type IV secretion system protein TrbF
VRLACRPETGASSPSAIYSWRPDLLRGSSGSRHKAPWCRGSFKSTSSSQIAWHLARFIEQVRSVPADPVIVRQNWLGAYDFTTDKGAAALNDYARTNDPFAKVGKVQVAVEVSSVIRASDSSFRVAWIERRYENGALAATERWTAILTIVLNTPHDIDRLRKNPLGIFVHAINWSKELG